jgi:hypothetical protein
MGIIQGTKDFLGGFQETVAADRFRWAVFVILVVVLSVLIWVLIATIL